MKELLHYLLSKIIGSDAEIEINEEMDGEVIVFNISIPQEHRGLVIGKNGMNIISIRNLVGIIARREDKMVRIKILD